jgi:hypothetical protein
VIGGDCLAHPSNIATGRILVTYSFRVAVSGEGSPEPPSIRMNNFILCPTIIVFKMNNPSSCVQWSLFFLCFLLPLTECSCKPKVQIKLGSFVVSLQSWNQFSEPSTEMELIQWPRAARSTTYEQDRCVCVCVILHISSWRYGHVVTLFWCINHDCSMMTVICVCVILHVKRHAFVIISVQYNFFVWFTYSLAKFEEQADGGWLRATPTLWQIN